MLKLFKHSVALLRLVYLCGQCLDWLQVEVVIQMQVVEVLAVDKEIEHVVALSAHLQAHLHPVQLCRLEKLGGFEGTEQISERKQQKRHIKTYTRLKTISQIIKSCIHLFFCAFGGLCLRALRT